MHARMYRCWLVWIAGFGASAIVFVRMGSTLSEGFVALVPQVPSMMVYLGLAHFTLSKLGTHGP